MASSLVISQGDLGTSIRKSVEQSPKPVNLNLDENFENLEILENLENFKLAYTVNLDIKYKFKNNFLRSPLTKNPCEEVYNMRNHSQIKATPSLLEPVYNHSPAKAKPRPWEA